jgi:hypothetical protein
VSFFFPALVLVPIIATDDDGALVMTWSCERLYNPQCAVERFILYLG